MISPLVSLTMLDGRIGRISPFEITGLTPGIAPDGTWVHLSSGYSLFVLGSVAEVERILYAPEVIP